MYLNGNPVAQNPGMLIRPMDFNPLQNYIGNSQWPDPLFNGRIDDFRVYNYALSPDQITSLYNGTRNNFVQHTLYEVIRLLGMISHPIQNLARKISLRFGLTIPNKKIVGGIAVQEFTETFGWKSLAQYMLLLGVWPFRITSYNVCYTKLLRVEKTLVIK